MTDDTGERSNTAVVLGEMPCWRGTNDRSCRQATVCAHPVAQVDGQIKGDAWIVCQKQICLPKESCWA